MAGSACTSKLCTLFSCVVGGRELILWTASPYLYSYCHIYKIELTVNKYYYSMSLDWCQQLILDQSVSSFEPKEDCGHIA
jgi:hypothetical protein